MVKIPETRPTPERAYDHELRIYDENLELIKNGDKTLEVRLEDAGISKIKAGDKVKFMSIGNQVIVKIIAVRSYPTVEELLKNELVHKILPGSTMEQISALPLARIFSRSKKNKIVLEIEKLS